MIKKLQFKRVLGYLLISTLFSYAQPIKIMPLGDSITYGDIANPENIRKGYRNYLWYKLEEANYDVDFVGSRSAGKGIKPKFDTDNEGYYGYTSYGLAEGTYSWLKSSSPDIVLLHAGSNDLSSSVSGIEDILNEIDNYEDVSAKEVTVILALIINENPNVSWITSLNKNITRMAKNRIDNGDKIVIVDMEKGAKINYSKDMSDFVHPSNSGYEKMASVWFKALEKIFGSHTVRIVQDINGDGQSDIVGFGNNGVMVSFSTGDGFTKPKVVAKNFGYKQGWRTNTHLRVMADIDGDGQSDIVGFGNNGVMVSFSTGDGFTKPKVVAKNFGYKQGWRTNTHLRLMADIDGDGQSDIVGFGNNGVMVSFSTGDGFTKPKVVAKNFGYKQGWRTNTHLRLMADINGDGQSDIVGFGNNGVMVSFSTGDGFTKPKVVAKNFGYKQGWRTNTHLRVMADINGDGQSDIVGFGNNGVMVSFSTGDGFTKPKVVAKNFGYKQGWRTNTHLRLMADIDGDGQSDIVGFGNNGVMVSFSTGDGFTKPKVVAKNFGYKQGWRTNTHLRLMADINGDGQSDIVGFGNNGVMVSFSTGDGFTKPKSLLNDFAYNNGWKI